MRLFKNTLFIFFFCTPVYMSYTFAQETAEVRQALSRYTFTFDNVTGIGHESGVTRRDPSDVIISNGKYHVYYTKVFGRAAGAFRPELTQAVDDADGLSWGISMVHNGNESYLVRWQIP